MTLQFKNRRKTVGTMVAVSIAVAVVLTAVLQMWAFQSGLRWDMTTAGVNSLDAGTRKSLDALGDRRIKLTSLYSELDIEHDAQRHYREAVEGLLELYQREYPHIEIEWINPLKKQGRLAAFIAEIRSLPTFRRTTELHDRAVATFRNDIAPQLAEALDGVIKELAATPPSGGDKKQIATEINNLVMAIEGWISVTDELKNALAEQARATVPDYPAAIRNIRKFYVEIGNNFDLFSRVYVDRQLQGDLLPDNIKAILVRMTAALQPFTERFATEQEALQNVPRVALSTLEDDILSGNAVVVQTTDSAAAITFEDMWPPLRPGSVVGAENTSERRFAGTSAVTRALLQLEHNARPMVCFVRYGGPQLFKPFNVLKPNAGQGPLFALKGELEAHNFLVAEWDVATNQTAPVFDPPPSRTIYVVLRPAPSQTPDGLQSGNALGRKERGAVLAAVSASGRALFLTGFDMFSPVYEYREYLKAKWGITVDGGTLIVEALPGSTPNQWTLPDSIGFLVNRAALADHPVTNDLEAVRPMIFPLPTTMTGTAAPPQGVTVTTLAHIPEDPDIWAVRDVADLIKSYDSSTTSSGRSITREETGGVTGSFPMVMTSETDDHKIVVVASGEKFIEDRFIAAQQVANKYERLAPGNYALFLNLLYYLDDASQWIGVASPLDRSRLDMTPRAIAWWRALVVAILPGLVAIAGFVTWRCRRH